MQSKLILLSFRAVYSWNILFHLHLFLNTHYILIVFSSHTTQLVFYHWGRNVCTWTCAWPPHPGFLIWKSDPKMISSCSKVASSGQTWVNYDIWILEGRDVPTLKLSIYHWVAVGMWVRSDHSNHCVQSHSICAFIW